MSWVPAAEHPHFDDWALAQLRLYKPHRSIHELCTPTVRSVFDAHVALGGFPNVGPDEANIPEDDGAGAEMLQREPDLLEPAPLEAHIRQDDYQQLMNLGRTHCDSSALLGVRELDVIYNWPSSWRGVSFAALVSWIVDAQKNAVLQPVSVQPLRTDSFSYKQRLAFNIVDAHCFGASRREQLLMIVIGTAGTGKSFLIDSIRSLFAARDCGSEIKITAPTGIAAANISGSTLFSLLSLHHTTLTGQRLLVLQRVMRDVRLLVIDEYSFMGASVFDSLDRHLRLIFPLSDLPFGGLNVLLCGDPAQLPPVQALPVYAHRGSTAHLAARFHLFTTVVELDQPFRQIGTDAMQARFRSVLERVADCAPERDDWNWLQTRRGCCLDENENRLFDDGMYIVSTNAVREKINYDKLAALSPVMKIEHSEEGVHFFTDDALNGECLQAGDLNVFAVGARVILSTNLWTETGLVNGACGVVDALLQPIGASKTRVVMVNFPKYRGPPVSVSAPTVVPITQIRTQYFAGLPLSLSWAITIHKSQGMSLDRVTVDLGKTEFAAGMTFVALSRARRFDGIRVTSFDFDRYRRIACGKHVDARREEFRRLRLLAARTVAFVSVYVFHFVPPFLTSVSFPLIYRAYNDIV